MKTYLCSIILLISSLTLPLHAQNYIPTPET